MSHSLGVLLAIVSLFLAVGIYMNMNVLETVFAVNNIQIQWPITANETSNKSVTQTSVIEGN
jgi:hypothetical protein